MKALTYHGDETIVRLFTTLHNAMDFAVAEVMDCTSVTKDEVILAIDKESIAEYADPDTVEAVILDQDGDFRIYTVTDLDVDTKYISKYS